MNWLIGKLVRTPSHRESSLNYEGYEILSWSIAAFIKNLLHHGVFDTFVILGMAFVSLIGRFIVSFTTFVTRVVRFTSLGWIDLKSILLWVLDKEEGPGDKVTTASVVNFVEDNFDIPEDVRARFPDLNGANFEMNSKVLIMASKLAYEPIKKCAKVVTQEWKMRWVAGYSFEPQGTQGFIFQHRSALVVTFRGTEPFNLWDWLVDAELRLIRATPHVRDNPNRAKLGYMHYGFFSALTNLADAEHYHEFDKNGHSRRMSPSQPRFLRPYDVIRKHIVEELRKDEDLRVYVTGHSLGAALACMFSALLLVDGEPEQGSDHGDISLKDRFQLLCTFGQPRTGGIKFAGYLDKMNDDPEQIFRYVRFVNCDDIVPRVPPAVQFYHHSTHVYLNWLGYEMVAREMQGLLTVKLLFVTCVSYMRRFRENLFKVPADIWNDQWMKAVFRVVIGFLPHAVYDHFPSQYERVIWNLTDPYYDENSW